MAEKSSTPVASPEDVAATAAAAEQEWGTFFAVAPISFNGSPAYNAGDPVPVSNVQKYKYEEQGLVAKVGSKAGQDFIAKVSEASNAPVTGETPQPVSLNLPLK